MTLTPDNQADVNLNNADSVEMVILPRTSDIGNLQVQRALPFKDKRMVGPFIFWDQMGSSELLAGQGLDVRPHPHIGLSTVTYLFDGTMDHKDSLGNDMRIIAGDVNLMTAGSGIVHSERTGQDIRQAPSRLYGIQSWLAQPLEHENGNPDFTHVAGQDLPTFSENGVTGRIILGELLGLKSPVPTQWNTLYAELHLQSEARLQIPNTTEERALYVLSGHIEIGGFVYPPEQMIVLRGGENVVIKALSPVHMMVLGGATMDSNRFVYWNFVSSSKERLEQAKQDWREGRFPTIKGDDKEFIPLPE